MHKTNINQQGSAHLFIIIIAVIVMVGGLGVYVAKNSAKKSFKSEATNTQAVKQIKPLPADLNGLLSVSQIKKLALDDKPGAIVSRVGLAQSKSGLVFHVELEDGSTLNVDAKSGTKVETDEIEDNEEGTKVPANFVSIIDFAKAQQLAMAKVPNGVIHRIELETEEGLSVYSVRFSKDIRVKVNATDGTIIGVKTANNPSIKHDDVSSSGSKSTDNISHSGKGTTTSTSTSTDSNKSGSGSNTTSTSGSTTSTSGGDTSHSGDVSDSGTSGGSSGSGGTSGSGSGGHN